MKSAFLAVSCLISTDAISSTDADEISGMLQAKHVAIQHLEPPDGELDDQEFDVCPAGQNNTATGLACWQVNRSPTTRYIQSGFKVDFSEAAFITPTKPIFEYSEILSLEDYDSREKTLCESSFSMQSQTLSTSFGLEGRYGAFAASISANANRASTGETSRMQCIISEDRRVQAVKSTQINDIEYVREDVKRSFNTEGPELIVKKFGQFYARKLWLGGVLRSTYSQDKSASSSADDFLVEMKADYDAIAVTGSAESQFGGGKTSKSSGQTVSLSFAVGGGRASIFNRKMDANKRKEWRDSVQAGHPGLQVVGARLEPIWTIVSRVNPAQGSAVKAYLELDWANTIKNMKGYDESPTSHVNCSEVQCGEFQVSRQSKANTKGDCCKDKYKMFRGTQRCDSGGEYVDVEKWEDCLDILQHAAYLYRNEVTGDGDERKYSNFPASLKGYRGWAQGGNMIKGCFIQTGGTEPNKGWGWFNPDFNNNGKSTDSWRPKVCQLLQTPEDQEATFDSMKYNSCQPK